MTTWYDTAASPFLTVRVGEGGAIQTNADPLDPDSPWLNRSSGTSVDLKAIAYSGVSFVAVGNEGIILRSPEGITWVTEVSGTVENLNDVAGANPIYIVVGDNGTALFSGAEGYDFEAMDLGEVVTEDLFGADIVGGQYTIVGDGGVIISGEVVSTDTNPYLNERTLTLDDVLVDNGVHYVSVADVMYFYEAYVSDDVTAIFKEIMQEGMYATSLSLDSTHYMNRDLSDSLSLSDYPQAPLVILREVFTLADNVSAAWLMTLLEELWFFQTEVSTSHYANVSLDDTVGVSGTLNGLTMFILSVEETAGIGDALTPNQILQNTLTEGLLLGGLLGRNGEIFDTWVVNTQTKAVSTYAGYDFESMAFSSIGSFATDGTKIYTLEGETDDGEAIEAWIRSGRLHFGTPNFKNVAYAYVGVTSDSDLVMKTITDTGVENWYKLVMSSVGDGAKATFGKGAKARYWQYELHNANGADFSLESITLVPVTLSRRF